MLDAIEKWIIILLARMSHKSELEEHLLSKDVEANPKLFNLRPDELAY
jgi:hypothetical protein